MTLQSLGTVVVTGGAGFIGCAIADLLADRAERWIAIDNLNPRIHEQPGRPSRLADAAELVVADITDATTWKDLLGDVTPDVIIHLASETDTGLSLDNVTRFSEVNVRGTAVMLDALAAHGILPAHVMVASSRAVYGEGQWRDRRTGAAFSPGQRTHSQLDRGEWDFPDADPVATRAGTTLANPTSIYGSSKLAQETMMSAWCGGRDVAFTGLRLQNVYGAGQSLINPYTGILPLFVQTAEKGQAIDVYEDGLMTRDFVHIDDVSRAFVAAVDRPSDSGARVLDIGGGEATSILDVARLIAHTAGGAEPTVSGRFRDGDIRHAWSELDAPAAELGWAPQIDWRTGIAEYAKWYQQLAADRKSF